MAGANERAPEHSAKQSARNYVRNNTDFNGKIHTSDLVNSHESSIRYW
jgi:hypothetical protein